VGGIQPCELGVSEVNGPRVGSGDGGVGEREFVEPGTDEVVTSLERPAKEIDVSVYAVGSEKVLAETTTDANGRWCVVLPSGREVGTDLVAEASIAETRYRRALVAEHGQNISVRSEALHRVFASEGSSNGADISSISPAVYLNLETVASSAADLVDPAGWRRGATLQSAPEQLEAQLMEDERFLERLERLGVER
jgi:hypothetical protein